MPTHAARLPWPAVDAPVEARGDDRRRGSRLPAKCGKGLALVHPINIKWGVAFPTAAVCAYRAGADAPVDLGVCGPRPGACRSDPSASLSMWRVAPHAINSLCPSSWRGVMTLPNHQRLPTLRPPLRFTHWFRMRRRTCRGPCGFRATGGDGGGNGSFHCEICLVPSIVTTRKPLSHKKRLRC